MDDENIQFITCPKCGEGSDNKNGTVCPNCADMGIGVFFEGKFLFFGLKIGRAIIGLRKARKSYNQLINFLAFVSGLVGFFAISYWVWEQSLLMGEESSFSYFYFWKHQSWFILVFWLSLIADMFVVYRITEESDARKKIKKFPEKLKQNKLPDNWERLKSFPNKQDVFKGYDEDVIVILENAFLMANNGNFKNIEVIHLFLSLLKNRRVSSLFVRLNVDIKGLEERLKKNLEKRYEHGENKEAPSMSSSSKEVLIRAFVEAYELEQKKVKFLNLLLPLIELDSDLEDILYDIEVDKNKVKNVIAWFRINDSLVKDYRAYKSAAMFKPSGNMDKAYTAVATPVLNHYSYDLTEAAKFGKLGVCVARDKELKKVIKSFESGKTGAILVGNLGVGKKTLVHGIARLMVQEKVPEFMADKRLVELDVGRLISGVTASEAQERMLIVVDEVVRAGNIFLYIKNVQNLVGISAGGEGSLELSEILADAINRGLIYCLSSATKQNFANYLEGKPLADAMETVKIEEPVGDQAIQIVESKVSILEAKYGVYFSYHSIEQAIDLSEKFVYDKFLPAKAIHILQMTAARVAPRCTRDKSQCMCTKEDIAEVITEITEIPTTKITEDEGEKLLNLENLIHERMINQVEAVKMVSDSLRRARAELREGKRPIASFLFLGPTGVGKTELAKTVAEIYFGSEGNMVRLDMSEYQNKDSVRKMIGNKGEAGYLTEAVRKKPFTMVLLDEVEKAHPDILNLFLQLMDDGRLTDGMGRTINFTNCIVVATSNAGALYIQEQLKNHDEHIDMAIIKQALINEHLNKVMRPELINRFDGLIVFGPLSLENVTDIARLMLKKTEKMLNIKGILLAIEEDGIRKLAELGYDPKFGARPLRRVLQDKIDNEIAKKILGGELKRRDTIVIDGNAEVNVEKGRNL